MADRITVYTEWDWREDSRPELRVCDDRNPDCVSCTLHIGKDRELEIDGGCSREDLMLQLQGYRDIFALAVEDMEAKPQPVANAVTAPPAVVSAATMRAMTRARDGLDTTF